MTLADITVRPVNPGVQADLESLLDLIEDYYREAWPHEAAIADWRDRYRVGLFDQIQKSRRSWLWRAYVGDDLVGLATFHLAGAETDQVGVVDELYVKPIHRHKHVGRSLIEAVKRELAEAGARRIRASVQFDELGNIKFFESYGFRIDRLNIVLDLDDKQA